MSRKNKIMMAVAIAAVVLLIGSGVARCTMASSAVEPSVQDGDETARSEQQASSEGSASGPENVQTGGLESLIGTSWVGTDDPASTLSIVKGAFVEKSGEETTVTYWTLDSEDEGTSTILASKSMNDAATPSVVVVSDTGSGITIRSDALAREYKQVQGGARTLYFSGVTSKLAESMGCDAAEIEAAVSSRVAAVSPQCERAVWDAEVWIDFANNTASTTFTLDDGASTIVSVTRASDGTIEAL